MRLLALLALLATGLFAGSLFAADEKKPKDDEAILGTWKFEKVDTGGENIPGTDAVAKLRMVFKKGGKLAMPGLDGKEEAEFKLDPTADPKTIDVKMDESRFTVGLYALDGDTLTLAMARSGSKTRPTEFKADAKAGSVVYTLKRVKEEKKEEKKDK